MADREPDYDSGPGRKWIFFMAGAGVAAFFGLVRRGDMVIVLTWLAMTGGLLALAGRAFRCRVTTDADGMTIRLWSRQRRVGWHEIGTVEVDPRTPDVILRSGEKIPLLDNWHPEPSGVAEEVRRRWLEHTS